MADPGSVALALIAAIWMRENARGSGFDRLNRIRDSIALEKADDKNLTKSHRYHMYKADWRPLAIGTTTITFMYAAVVASIPFILSTNANTALIVLCIGISLYQVGSGIMTVSTLINDAKYINKAIAKSSADPKEAIELKTQ